MKILLLEDDISLNQMISHILRYDNHIVTRCYDGNDVLEKIDSGELYDLYLFDINVPHINGKDVLKYLYTKDKNVKVIIISAQTDIQTITEAYDNGCVDFLKKPFHLEELRYKLDLYGTSNIEYISQDIYFERDQDKLYRLGKEIILTKKEARLIALFVQNIGNVVTFETLYHKLYDSTESKHALRALIKRLKNKLNIDSCIESVKQEGYRLNKVSSIPKGNN